MSKTMWIILAMALVTYVPRVLPFLMIQEKPLPKKLKAFLDYVPISVLGALIIPGSIESIEGKPMIAFAGILAAAISAWRFKGLVIPVVISIITVYGLLLLT